MENNDEDDQKEGQMIERTDKDKEHVSIKHMLEKDIMYQDLPQSVKDYFQLTLDGMPQSIISYKSPIEIIHRMKIALTSSYLHDALFDHFIKTIEKYKDTDNPEEWARQINPTMITKFYQMGNAVSEQMTEVFDTTGMGEDFGKGEEITIKKIRLEQKIIRKKAPPKEDNIIEGDFEVVTEDV